VCAVLLRGDAADARRGAEAHDVVDAVGVGFHVRHQRRALADAVVLLDEIERRAQTWIEQHGSEFPGDSTTGIMGETEAEQERFDHIMAIYAACVAHMDTAVGRLMAALKQRGALDNTLILFLSDNGGNAESGIRGRLEGDSPGAGGSTVYGGESWATLENTPFRRYKHYNHEGGISTPLVVHWPTGFAARGELRQQPGHLVDIMATCVDVGGAKYPTQFQGKPIVPMEGRSLVPAFADKPTFALRLSLILV